MKVNKTGKAALKVAVLASVYAIVLLSGCMSVKKAQAFLEKKNVLAKICAGSYPLDTIINKSDTTYRIDSFQVYYPVTDTVDHNDTIFITKTGTAYRYITKTVVVSHTVLDSAKLVASRIEVADQKIKIDSITAKNDRYKAQRTRMILWLVISLLLFLIMAAFSLYKIFK